MELSMFSDFTGVIVASFQSFHEFIFTQEILGVNLGTLLLGTSLAIYITWTITKWVIDL